MFVYKGEFVQVVGDGLDPQVIKESTGEAVGWLWSDLRSGDVQLGITGHAGRAIGWFYRPGSGLTAVVVKKWNADGCWWTHQGWDFTTHAY